MHLYIWSTMHQIKLTKQTKIETDHQFNYLPTCTTHTFITTAFSWSSFNLHIKSVQIRTKKKSKKAKWRPAPATPALPPAPAAATGASVLAAEYAYTYLHLHTHSFLFFPFFYLLKKARRCQSADPILGIALRQDTLRTISSPAGCEKEMI